MHLCFSSFLLITLLFFYMPGFTVQMTFNAALHLGCGKRIRACVPPFLGTHNFKNAISGLLFSFFYFRRRLCFVSQVGTIVSPVSGLTIRATEHNSKRLAPYAV
uniref:Secreted protein n=1 Tax=Ixodes ricinus TaxID=34613 RepID=A0A6B0UII9_IXORI